ncbi:MAG: hypothetical protein RR184_20250, partial [Citrobacter sp.]
YHVITEPAGQFRNSPSRASSVGINPRYDIPFEGDMHNALLRKLQKLLAISATPISSDNCGVTAYR